MPNQDKTQNLIKIIYRCYSHFVLNEPYYKQVDRIALTSPLWPTLCNVFLGFYEKGGWKSALMNSNLFIIEDMYMILFYHLSPKIIYLNFAIIQANNGKRKIVFSRCGNVLWWRLYVHWCLWTFWHFLPATWEFGMNFIFWKLFNLFRRE